MTITLGSGDSYLRQEHFSPDYASFAVRETRRLRQVEQLETSDTEIFHFLEMDIILTTTPCLSK